MQNAYGKYTLGLILTVFFQSVSGQIRIRFETAEGFPVEHLQVQAWTAWGVEIFPKKDSIRNEWLFYKPLNRLRVSGSGYITYDTVYSSEIAMGTSLIVLLETEKKILDEAIVSVSRSQEKIRDATVSVTLIKPYLIENKVALDGGQVLDQVPGLNVADNQVNIRNGNGWSYGAGSRVMILVDDLPMLSADAQSAQMSFLPLEQTAGIEVVKSAGSVLYGSSALNGVIHLRTVEPGEKPQVLASVYTGLYGNPPRDSLKWWKGPRTVSGSSGMAAFKKGQWGFVASFNALHNEGYRMNEYERRGRISLRIKRTSVSVPGLQYGFSVSGQTGRSGSFLLWQNFREGYIPQDSSYNYSHSGKIALDPVIRLDGRRLQQLLQGRILLLDNQIDNGDPDNRQSNSSVLAYGEYRAGTDLLQKKLRVTGGTVWMHSQTHSPLFSGLQTAQNAAAYIQTDVKLRRIRLQGGFRAEHFRLNQFQQTRPVFRAGGNYTLAKFTNLRASWGQGYRFPSIAEAFISTSAGDIRIFPNPDLRPESGNSAEIGIKQGFRLGKFHAYADLAAFRTVYQNLMEFTFAQWGDIFSPGLGIGFKSVNTREAKISGLEFESAGFGNIGKYDIKWIGGYTYTIPLSMEPDSVFARNHDGTGISFSNTRADSTAYLKYRYRHLVRADIQIRRGKFEPGISVRYQSTMLNMDDAFVNISPSIREAWNSLGGALVCDLRLGVYARESLRLNFQVVNAGNALYFNRPADLRPPRSYQLQLLWHLN